MLSILYQAMAIREDIIVAPTGLSYGMVHGGQTMTIIILKVGLSSPINLGMNLGRLVKLSRIKYYQRSGGSKWQYLYAHGNPKRFRVWGTPTTDSVQLDITEPGNDWILLIGIHFC